MSQHPTAQGTPAYYIPQPMPWPIMGSVGLFCMALGAVFVFNGISAGWVSLALGTVIILYMLYRWFGVGPLAAAVVSTMAMLLQVGGLAAAASGFGTMAAAGALVVLVLATLRSFQTRRPWPLVIAGVIAGG